MSPKIPFSFTVGVDNWKHNIFDKLLIEFFLLSKLFHVNKYTRFRVLHFNKKRVYTLLFQEISIETQRLHFWYDFCRRYCVFNQSNRVFVITRLSPGLAVGKCLIRSTVKTELSIFNQLRLLLSPLIIYFQTLCRAVIFVQIKFANIMGRADHRLMARKGLPH